MAEIPNDKVNEPIPATKLVTEALAAFSAQVNEQRVLNTKIVERLEHLTERKSFINALIDATLTGVPAIIVALSSFGIVHILTVRRQRRDEFFKVVQGILQEVKDVTTSATSFWGAPIDRQQASLKSASHSAQIGRIGIKAEMLRERKSRFDISRELVSFRRQVTTDAESERDGGNSFRVTEIDLAAGDLEKAIEKAYYRIFG